ncbi:Transcriptional regulator, AraC family [Fulvivirga imtechensis AK7]|uniref:Transcriptional regulator, AraC family n=1 Tax=Fulvivirga imtechensis AK7 TaxID=1237149 RepID=L8JT86_9BACT|nr:AraC family transcriptional regulator [Fulvivirga imtechensis]ELR72050.1 Transcriptional regulator, AraC family [Fulvivirga imtechensis AK7]
MKPEIQTKNKIEDENGIKVATFRKNIRTTTPHKHNSYFEIIYISKGSGHHSIDGVQFRIDPPVLFFVRKEQVHHWALQSEPEGYVLIIKNSFVRNSLDKELGALIARLSTQSALKVTSPACIDSLFKLLTEEMKISLEENIRVVEGLLKALLAKILMVTRPHLQHVKGTSPAFNAFLELLLQERNLMNSVAHYARLLHVTPQNLNSICRKAVNHSASDIIADLIVNEAKRLLIYTDKTIGEVAFELNFKDPSHFVKYFKRLSGQTPKSYREKERLVP